jgi:DNA repair exonuclease SbcCD ATPase subunit
MFGVSAFTFSHPCDEPLAYSIGNIDSEFNLSVEEFELLAKDAEKVWEEQTGLDLFDAVESSEGSVVINAVHDHRQENYVYIASLDDEITDVNKMINNKKAELDDLTNRIKASTQSIDSKSARFNERANKYNQDVKIWNQDQERSDITYEYLESEKKALQDIELEIANDQQTIQLLQADYKKLSQLHNDLVVEHNELARDRNEKTPTAPFRKGVYSDDEITIYQFNERKDLVAVLAHELGHSLGIEHTEDPQSLMYYLVHNNDTFTGDTVKLYPEDKRALEKVCGINGNKRLSYLHQLTLRDWVKNML